MGHDEIVELLGAYALNAVEPGERTAIEQHLLECPRCRAEVRDHVWVATRLGNRGGDAPDGVWEKIADALEETAPPMRLDLPAGDARVLPLSARRRAGMPRVATIAAGIAAAAVIGVLGVQVQRQDDRIDTLKAAVAADAAVREVPEAFTDPGAALARLTSPDGSTALPAALLEDGRGYLMAEDLPALAADRTYQLWGQTSAGLISLGLLGSDPNEVVTFQSSDDVAALAITEEAAGGVSQSQNPPALLGRFD
jgi:hypothetical protein